MARKDNSASVIQSTADKENIRTTNGKLRGDLILAKSIVEAIKRNKEKASHEIVYNTLLLYYYYRVAMLTTNG